MSPLPSWAQVLERRGVRAGIRTAAVLPGALGARARYLDLVARMDTGDVPPTWRREMHAALARADALLADGRLDDALLWFDKALRLAYHATLHYSEEVSPLIEDPEAFLAPFRAGELGHLLLTPAEHDEGPVRPAPRPADPTAPVRLLVVAQRNWTFVEPVLRALETEGFEIRRLEVDDLPPSERPTRARVLRARLDLALTGSRIPTPPVLVEEFEWADVVLVEWGHHVLTWMSLLETMPRLTAARFHRFEAYTPFPLLTDFAVIDRVLFVSPHVRTLVGRLAPDLERAGAVIGVDNFLAYGLGEDPGTDADPFLLAQVGWLRPVKDVLFTLEVLARLREKDPRHRLLLVGPGLPDSPADDTSYQRRVRDRLAGFAPGAVEVLGARTDVPEILAGVGWIVSSSLHEGVHEAVMEGLAAGCAPLIRNWPDARAYGGASVIYPEAWVIQDVESAVRRVLEVEAAGTLEELSAEARRWVVQRRSPHTVAQRYVEALSPSADA